MGEKIILLLVLILIASVTINDMIVNGYSNEQLFYLLAAISLVAYIWLKKKKQ